MGKTVGEVAGRMISPRAKFLFLSVLFMALTIVLAIFGLVIAAIFKMYPESVLSVWIEIPIAIVIGIWVYRYTGNLLLPSILALGMMYLAIYIGAYYCPVEISASFCEEIAATLGLASTAVNPIVVWTVILMIYCFIASVLPVWVLL